MEKNPA